MYILENVPVDTVLSDRGAVAAAYAEPQRAPARSAWGFLFAIGRAVKRTYFGDGRPDQEIDGEPNEGEGVILSPHVLPPLL